MKKTTNKFSILETLPEDDPIEMNMLKDRMIVDQFLNKKIQPNVNETSHWSQDMIKYFKDKWEEGRKKEAEENTQKANNIRSEEDDIFIEEKVMKIIISGSLPWAIIGDMTVTLNLEEHPNRGSSIIEEMQDFKDCINLVEVKDIGSCSFFYTCIKSLRIPKNSILKKLDRDPYNNQIKKKPVEILDEYNEVVKDDEKLFPQKARVDWLNDGDKNSSLFHKVIKGRRSRIRVAIVCDENGVSYERDKDLFCTILTHEEAESMVREVSGKEIKDAIFEIGDNRAPDLQKAYDTVSWNFLESILKKFRFHHKMRKIGNCRDFKYHHGCKELKLVNLCFVDDLMNLCHGDTTSAGLIKEALREFSEVFGRLLLISVVKKSTSVYWASIFKIPKTVIEKINGVLKRFLWSNGDYAKGRAKVAWKHVLRDKVADRLQHKVGDGSNIYIWYDKWQNNGLLIDQVSNKDLYDARMPKMIKLADMIDEGVWKWPSEWRNVELEVMNIEVPRLKNGVHDKVKWKCADNSRMPFHTKLVMDVLSPNLEKINWHVLVWFKQCIPKHVFCLWIAMLKRLQTQDNIMTWGTQTGLLCPLCSKVNDSHSHIFFICD
ncbi:RNA-directed DNA polymerase, eukaryota, reverse transcriptase zinc-binding domain protein [Tanacetum coccineum]